MMLLLTIPLIFLELINIFIDCLEFGGWNLLSYLIIFIQGYIFASNNKFKKVIEKNKNINIIFIVTKIGLVLVVIIVFQDELLDSSLQFTDFLFFGLRVINEWSWMIVLLGQQVDISIEIINHVNFYMKLSCHFMYFIRLQQ